MTQEEAKKLLTCPKCGHTEWSIVCYASFNITVNLKTKDYSYEYDSILDACDEEPAICRNCDYKGVDSKTIDMAIGHLI